jgi:serine/threonine protein kinase/regulation of enolase protein 1 (concanavalin A-like superfamily)
MTEREIFLAALKQPTAGERAAFLDQTCGSDANLRGQLEALLAEHEHLGSYLEAPVAAAQRTLDEAPATERPGTVIGPYKVLQQIGEGGMGVVWMAEQTRPVQRKVALKVIKPGMDSRQVIARFEAERQALALMDHVNIARVFDGGATTGEPGGVSPGRPYFVMELVHGVPITKYCDDNHLTPRERLELFVPVCQAIQHAHQKGIIHRDIKPSNVMITLYDGKPVPKVIDFGVAKATEQKLTELTLFTQYGTMVGTLEYMSPEQAEMSALGVDTRSDIYSLGVLLYELLTGSTPLTHKRMKEAAYAEILRMIKEEEPPRPSTRLSDSGEPLASISAQRQMEPAKLTRLVRGELDWIVMKALEKDRNRRYETANGFAQDVQRYMADEPVQACPPSRGYRLRKFARRNKLMLHAGMLVLIALVLGTVVSTWQAIRAGKAYESETVQRARAEENLGKARAAVHDYFVLVSDSPELESVPLQPLRKALLNRALVYYREFMLQAGDDPALQAEVAATYFRVAVIYLTLGRPDDSLDALERGARATQVLTRDGLQHAAQFQRLSGLWKQSVQMHRSVGMPGDPVRARAALESVVALWERLVREHPTDAGFQSDLAFLTYELGDLLCDGNKREGLASLQKAEQGWRRLARQHPDVGAYRAGLAQTLHRIAAPLRDLGHRKEADQALESAEALRQELVAQAPASVRYRAELVHSLVLRGARLAQRKETAQAEKDYRRAIELGDALVVEVPGVPYVMEMLAEAHSRLAGLQSAASQHAEAADHYRLAVALFRTMVDRGANEPEARFQWSRQAANCAANMHKLAEVHESQNNQKEAEKTFGEAIALYDQVAKAFPDRLDAAVQSVQCLGRLGSLLQRMGRTDSARQLLQNGIDRLEVLAARPQVPPHERVVLGQLYCSLTWVLLQADKTKEAESSSRKALALFEDLAGAHPKSSYYRQELGFSHRLLGDVLRKGGSTDDAERSYRAALAIYVKLTVDEPDHPFFAQEVGFAHWCLGWLYETQNRLALAEEAFRQALVVYEQAAERFPNDAEMRLRTARSREFLAAVRKKQDKEVNEGHGTKSGRWGPYRQASPHPPGTGPSRLQRRGRDNPLLGFVSYGLNAEGLPMENSIIDNRDALAGRGLPTQFRWHCEPHRWSFGDGRLLIEPDAPTDFWQRTHYGFRADNGHFLYRVSDGDFVLTVRVLSRPTHQYDQAGVMVRVSADCWLKSAVEFETSGPSRLGAVVTNHGYSDWSAQDYAPGAGQVWLRVRREGDDYIVDASSDGGQWGQLRMAHLHDGRAAPVACGVYACSPEGRDSPASLQSCRSPLVAS